LQSFFFITVYHGFPQKAIGALQKKRKKETSKSESFFVVCSFDKLQFVGDLLFFRERKVSKRKLLQKRFFMN